MLKTQTDTTEINLQLPDSCVSSSSPCLSASLRLLQVNWFGWPDALGKLSEAERRRGVWEREENRGNGLEAETERIEVQQ